ncbi:MAG: thioredoxin family protein [Bacteroidales bacterium]|nr:thioredoxin family protein [Bacteroidales bacterium]
MKHLVFGFLLFLYSGLQAQELNKVIIDPDLNREILVGWVDRAGISSKDYLSNEQQKMDAYQADAEAISYLKEAFSADKSLRILVVFGTWCGDSKMNVPDFFKVADLAQISNVKYLAVNRKKNANGVDMSKMHIERVPTFIVYRGDNEIGRIIENPNYTLENDLVAILKK